MRERLKKRKKLNLIIIELRSEAVKPRHWVKLLLRFG
jgi:hypothetical protein